MLNFRFLKAFILFGIAIIFAAGCRSPEILSPLGDTTIDAGDSISFASESYPNAIYKWTFDGGAKDALGQNPTVQFNRPGVYNVCLTVVFEDLDSGIATRKVTVRDSNQNTGDTKYLAKNVVFNKDGLTTTATQNSEALVQPADIDTETQVLAENVIFENTDISQIESDNVQDALEEISLKLSETMVGTWNIQNYIHTDSHSETGRIIIYGDGTFDLLEGSFAAVGMGSGDSPMPICNHTEENQTYQIIVDDLIIFTHFNPNFMNPSQLTENSVVPTLVKLRQNEIVFIGGGGCGAVSKQRVSILTRIID